MAFGEEGAYGHKKLGGIEHILGEALKRLTGEDILNQLVSHLMRSGTWTIWTTGRTTGPGSATWKESRCSSADAGSGCSRMGQVLAPALAAALLTFDENDIERLEDVYGRK